MSRYITPHAWQYCEAAGAPSALVTSSMPTCRASHIRSSLVSPCRSNNHRRTQNLLGGSIRKVRSTRYASTATALAPQAKLSDQESFFRRKTRTTLHRTAQFLPRVLPVGKKSQSAAYLSFWQTLLDGAYDDLNHPPADAAARVVGTRLCVASTY